MLLSYTRCGQVIEARQIGVLVENQMNEVFDLQWNREAVIEKQKSDPELARIYTGVEQGLPQPPWEEVAVSKESSKALWWQWARLAVREGLLCRRWESPDGTEVTWQVVIPGVLRHTFVMQVHGGMTGGHLGLAKTLEQVSRRAYWPTWRTDTAKSLKSWVPGHSNPKGIHPTKWG